MKTGGIYIAIVGILIIALLFYVGATQRNLDNEATPTPTMTDDGEESVIDDNWVEYTNNEVGFRIEHPEVMEVVDPPVGGVNFSYLGPSQTDNTEIFDGISVTITRETMENRADNIKEFAENELEDAKTHGEITKELEPVTVNGLSGYTFTLDSLALVTYVIVEHSSEMVLSITHISPDPEERGYADVVDRMLSTLEIQ